MERPILMTADSVKAILDGRKTMTRRVVKDPRRPSRERDAFLSFAPGKPDIGDLMREAELTKNIKPNYPCPYGQVGDRGFTYFKDSAPTSDGYYEVIWEEGDKSQLVYLKRHNLPDLPTDIPTEHEWERWLWGKDEHDDPEAISLDIRSPALIQWRRVGDRLWVRESYYRYGRWAKNGFTKTGKQAWKFVGTTDQIRYTDNPPEKIWYGWTREQLNSRGHSDWHKRPSIFMPRWASRITLEITEVRVERLQEITEEDFLCEGGWKCCEGICGEGTMAYGFGEGDKITRGEYSLNHKDEFGKLWDSINGKKYPWSSNPWCWVIQFDNIGVRVK